MNLKEWNQLSSNWEKAESNRQRQEHTAAIFFETISRDDSQAVLRLIQRGCSPNLLLGQKSPLMTAAEYGASDTLGLLLQYGGHLSVQDEKGQDALFWAISSQSNPCVDLILSRPEYRYKRLFDDNSTALILAAKRGYVHGVRAICTHQKNQVDLVDRRGQSALWHVLSKAEMTPADNEIARILLDNGANPDQEDLLGVTPRASAHSLAAQAALEQQELKDAMAQSFDIDEPSVDPEPVQPKPRLRL